MAFHFAGFRHFIFALPLIAIRFRCLLFIATLSCHTPRCHSLIATFSRCRHFSIGFHFRGHDDIDFSPFFAMPIIFAFRCRLPFSERY
jgi:hypothetical protein